MFVLICYVSGVHLNVFVLCIGSYLLFFVSIWRRIYHICFNVILNDHYQEQNILTISKENRVNPEWFVVFWFFLCIYVFLYVYRWLFILPLLIDWVTNKSRNVIILVHNRHMINTLLSYIEWFPNIICILHVILIIDHFVILSEYFTVALSAEHVLLCFTIWMLTF